jgi:prephenate dehydrogenase
MTVSALPVGKLVVVGVGLIGGSFALALRAAQKVDTIVGVGRNRGNLDAAQALSIVDRSVTLDGDWRAELADADLVLLATPVRQYPDLMRTIATHIGARTIVTEAGSTKQDVIAAARSTLGATLPRFVPGHPIAGTEHSGATAAFATLYRDRNVVLTPLPETDPAAVAAVTELWMSCGAQVCTMDAARHDRIFAAVSHLPHLLAFAVVDAFAARVDADDIFRFAASGFATSPASPAARPRCGGTFRLPTAMRCSPRSPHFAFNSIGSRQWFRGAMVQRSKPCSPTREMHGAIGKPGKTQRASARKPFGEAMAEGAGFR